MTADRAATPIDVIADPSLGHTLAGSPPGNLRGVPRRVGS
jgi:hypothetical protein